MASDDLLKSWERTEAFLRDARSRLSQFADAVFADELRDFQEFLDNNELEPALDILDHVFRESRMESWRTLELMALAAASMNMVERQRAYDDQLTKARGWKYETRLPES